MVSAIIRQSKILRPKGLSYSASERCISAACGKRTAPPRGLLFAADGCGDQVLDRIGGGVIPLFRERAAARPSREGRGRMGDRSLGVAGQDRRMRIGDI